MKKLLAQAALEKAVQDIGVREQPLGSNLGKRVEEMQRNAGVTPPQPYCACGIFTWFKEGAEALGIPNPVRRTGYCPDLLNWGKEQGLTVNPSHAKPGDIILFYHASMGRMAHTEIVKENRGNGTLITVGANTNANGARNGDGVYQKVREPGSRDVVLNMQGYGVEVGAAAPTAGHTAAPVQIALAIENLKVWDAHTHEALATAILDRPMRAEVDVASKTLTVRVG